MWKIAYIQLLYVDWNLSYRLSGVCVEEHLLCVTYFGNIFNRLEDTDFVIDRHYRNKCGIGLYSLLKLLE